MGVGLGTAQDLYLGDTKLGRDTHEPSESCQSSSLPLGFVVLTGSPQSCPPPQQAHLLYSPHAPQHEGLGVWGHQGRSPPTFSICLDLEAQGTGPGPLKVWAEFLCGFIPASQTVQDPRTSQAQLPSSLSPPASFIFFKEALLSHTLRWGVGHPLLQEDRRAATQGSPIRLLPPRREGVGSRSQQPPAPTALPAAQSPSNNQV